MVGSFYLIKLGGITDTSSSLLPNSPLFIVFDYHYRFQEGTLLFPLSLRFHLHFRYIYMAC